MLKVGVRVVRGPNWSQDDEDGGEGFTGTLYQVNKPEKTVIVQWDNGNQTLCKIGREEKYDLRVIDNAQIGVVHGGIFCDECVYIGICGTRYKCNVCYNYDLCHFCYWGGRHNPHHTFREIQGPNTVGHRLPPRLTCGNFLPDEGNIDWNWSNQDGGHGVVHQGILCDECKPIGISGMRYKCNDCYNYDLCFFCYHGGKHFLDHNFQMIISPDSEGFDLTSRLISRKCELRGIFKGAKVVRGIDWDFNNQDGGSGKTGIVQDIRRWNPESWRSAAYVKWKCGNSDKYRLGHEGYCDLQCVKASTPFNNYYYPTHLPILGRASDPVYQTSYINDTEETFDLLSLCAAAGGLTLTDNKQSSSTAKSSHEEVTSAERIKHLESQIEEIEKIHTCVICLERKRDVVFLCGHGTCSNCAENLSLCHLCREPITEIIRIY